MVLGVVCLAPVLAVALPLLLPVLKPPPEVGPVPPKPPTEQGRSENPTSPVSGGYLQLRAGTILQDLEKLFSGWLILGFYYVLIHFYTGL